MFTFVESTAFDRHREVYLDDEEYSDLQQYMMQHPELGKLVPGSGGVRKLRWRRAGMGKQGGLRVIYYVQREPDEIWMLTLYSKSVNDNIPGYVLRQMLEAFRNE